MRSVQAEAGGAEALSLMEKENYHLILTDLPMWKRSTAWKFSPGPRSGVRMMK
jgi:CheY-like chemotaxis protein